MWFPSFEYFTLIIASLFIPSCILVGWAHYKKVPMYRMEQEVNAESSPYFVDAYAVYSALLKLGEQAHITSTPEMIRLRELIDAEKKR